MEHHLKVGKLYRYAGASYLGTHLVLENLGRNADACVYPYERVLVLNKNGHIERCALVLVLCEEVG